MPSEINHYLKQIKSPKLPGGSQGWKTTFDKKTIYKVREEFCVKYCVFKLDFHTSELQNNDRFVSNKTEFCEICAIMGLFQIIEIQKTLKEENLVPWTVNLPGKYFLSKFFFFIFQFESYFFLRKAQFIYVFWTSNFLLFCAQEYAQIKQQHTGSNNVRVNISWNATRISI